MVYVLKNIEPIIANFPNDAAIFLQDLVKERKGLLKIITISEKPDYLYAEDFLEIN
jgi:hypothetical protein